ncbi:MAG: cysteine synthase, partial [Nitrospinaceae bacterium]|nr:cysteine synthase [Nitrospinaceae bacterium]
MSKLKMKLTLPTEVQTPSCPVITNSGVLKSIGNTPIIRIKKLGQEFKDVTILAKAEWKNAGGSVKARPALKMIEDGEKSGELTKDKIIL